MSGRYKLLVMVALAIAVALLVGDVVAKPGELPPP